MRNPSFAPSARLALAAIILTLPLVACGDDPTALADGPPPSILSVEPATGTVGTDLRVRGANFRSGASARIGGLRASQVDVASSSEVFARVPTGVVEGTTYDVTVTNSDGTEVTFPAAFTAVLPTLSFVNGATKPSGNSGSTVILEGAAFGDAQGPGRVLFSDGVGGTVAATIAGAEDWTDGFILTTVPAGAASGPVMVETGTGQSGSLSFTVTQNAAFSPSTISWTETQALPVAMSGHSGTYVRIDDAGGATVERIYVVGGSGNDAIPMAGVHYGTIETGGSIAGWAAGSPLTMGVAHHSTLAATPFNSKVQGSGFLYVMGGIEVENGQPVGAIRRIPLSEDGTTGEAETVGALPAPLHSFGAVLFRSTIYIAGGATTDDEPVAAAYRAAIDTLGNIGAWEALPDLPEARSYHDFVGFGGFLYAVGGETAAMPVDDANFTQNQTKLSSVAHARINLRTGLLSDGWVVSGSSMQKSRSKHVALAAGGSLFVSSGLYAAAGTGSSENAYATINSDGTVGSFGGATGSNTLQAVGGMNLYGASGVAYVDSDGVAHVMILAGDDVNSPGTKSAKVIFY